MKIASRLILGFFPAIHVFFGVLFTFFLPSFDYSHADLISVLDILLFLSVHILSPAFMIFMYLYKKINKLMPLVLFNISAFIFFNAWVCMSPCYWIFIVLQFFISCLSFWMLMRR